MEKGTQICLIQVLKGLGCGISRQSPTSTRCPRQGVYHQRPALFSGIEVGWGGKGSHRRVNMGEL